MDKVSSVDELMCNVSRDRNFKKKNQKEMLEIKNIVTKMKKKAFERVINRVDMAGRRIFEFDDISI